MFFRSERLFLRPGWPEDWRELFDRIADEQIVRNLARAPWPYRPDDARHFAALEQDRRFPHFLVTLPQNACGNGGGAQVVGTVSLIDAADGLELGYWIARDHWGRGYACEAGRAALSIARTLGHRHVRAAHFTDNPASARVLAKLGFRSTGRTEPRYSLARGGAAPALVMERDLAVASGGDDDGAGGGTGCDKAPMRRAA